MDNNEQQPESLSKLLKEQNKLISHQGIIVARIAGMLLTIEIILVLNLIATGLALLFR